MENLLTEFLESLKSLGVSKKDRLLLAVSGGLDSVALTHCCLMAGLDFGIAHVNFQLRGLESIRDENFVRQLAERHRKELFVKSFETGEYAEQQKISIQEAARDLRYTWFKSLIGRAPGQFQYLLTAHHLNDSVETMMMHFFRGTGITGLSGIPQKNGYIVRPLLPFSKIRLRTFLEEHHLEWMEDSSNNSLDYTRNYFRNNLIPELGNIYPSVDRNLENNLLRFSEAAILYNESVSYHKKKLINQQGAEWHIPILLLKKTKPLRTIIYEIIRDFQFNSAQTDEVIRLMESPNGKYIKSQTHRIIKNRRWLIIAPLESAGVEHLIVEQTDLETKFPEGILRLKTTSNKIPATVPTKPELVTLDAEKIQFPLLLRKWRNGDYFYPLGMKKKKKLARFFIDQKLSKTAKEKTWVLLSDKQVIWVVGLRIDNRFSISDSTKMILEIRYDKDLSVI